MHLTFNHDSKLHIPLTPSLFPSHPQGLGLADAREVHCQNSSYSEKPQIEPKEKVLQAPREKVNFHLYKTFQL